MPAYDDSDDYDGPSTDEIERVVKRALRRYGYEVDGPEDDDPPATRLTLDDAEELRKSALRRCGFLPSPPLPGEPHPLAPAGPKFKDLRIQSGWTVEEISERTGMPVDFLTAFEEGDSAAAGELTSFALERLATTCCGTLADLLGSEHPWVKAAHRRDSRVGRSIAIDPHG